jgi:hypothetical protein
VIRANLLALGRVESFAPQEVGMQPGLESHIGFAHHEKPILDSYDSAEECSLYHWMELCKLVDQDEDAELEEIVEEAVSEV